jgi:nucleotide-binding universal stress UspA family protein
VQLEKTLLRLRDRVQQNGIQIETQVALGRLAEEIIRKAQENQVDWIVVGARRMSAVKELTWDRSRSRHSVVLPVLGW